ncbi:unnamed protein product [Rotaria magnacalcarata]|uniref:Pentapeptide repeat-containing protein n=1 Tax=Rotaria magnacalcarata TaxID=392030 RepID=A0A816UG02_9BILA|nr:unnamed protein product [Rotaria magnacalcarata]
MPDKSTSTENDQNHQCCGRGVFQDFWSGFSSLLVPMMIAAFTITTTMLQMNATKQINEQNLKIAIENRDIANHTRHQQLEIEEKRQEREREYQKEQWNIEKFIAEENRKQDLQIAKDNRDKNELIEQQRQDKDIQIANQTRLHQIEIEETRLKQERQLEEDRRAADFRATENRQMDTYLAAYLKEMSDFLLAENFTLKNSRLAIVLRAKTITVLRQLDSKRKAHVIQFLYEAELLRNNENSLDLSGAELNNIDLSGRKLDLISLSGAILHGANFTGTSLSASNFNYAQLTGASFAASLASNSNFTYAQLMHTNFQNIANFTRAVIENGTFIQARLINTSYREIHGHSILFDQTLLDDADFDYAYLVQASFKLASLCSASFKFTKLSSTDWLDATLLGANFREAQLRGANINKQQLRQMFSFEKAVLAKGVIMPRTNLLINGDAEKKTRAGCSTTNWKTDESMVARTYSSDRVPTSLGMCYFTGLENKFLATMYQRVNINGTMESEGRTQRLWFHSRCRRLIAADEFFPGFLLREFNHENYNIKNHSWTLTAKTEESNDEKWFSYDATTTQIELQITFKRKQTGSLNLTFGYCDNLRIAVYDNTYA